MDRLLDDAKRMVLAWAGPTKPMLAPMAFWWDGGNLWCSTSGAAGKTKALRRDADCVLWVPPEEDGQTGRVVRGRARVYDPTDVRAMAIHGAVVATAQAALAVKHYASVAGYVVDAAKIPAKWLPTRRVMLCINAEEIREVALPPVGPGIAPALPTSVPPEIRRQLSGLRRIVVGTDVGGGLGLMPAVWGAGLSLDLPGGAQLVDGSPVTAVLDHDPGFRPTEVVGISLHGHVRDQRIAADVVRWWSGFEQGRAEVGADPVGRIVIPD